MKLRTKKSQRQKSPGLSASTRMGSKFRVVIVDENPLCRSGLRELLRGDARFHVLAECDHGETGLRVILEHKPDVAVLDANLPGINGVDMAALLKTKDRRINPVILAQHKDEKLFNRAIS